MRYHREGTEGIKVTASAFVMLLGVFSAIAAISHAEANAGADAAQLTGQDAFPAMGPNRPPRIGGNPDTLVRPGELYRFVPFAFDLDGDPLTFYVSRLPAWAYFDPATGAVVGRPTRADVGIYGGISIAVSDGQQGAGLPRFRIAVVPANTGTATLGWIPPTENEDGSPLVDLAGFRIYYGQGLQQQFNVIDVQDPDATGHVVTRLGPGTYYFTLTAYNASGLESEFANPVSKTIE